VGPRDCLEAMAKGKKIPSLLPPGIELRSPNP